MLMLWKKQLIGWRPTNGSTLIVLIEGRSTGDSSSMRKAMKDGAGSKWRPAMKITIQITVESDDGQLNVSQEVAHLDRGTLRPETLGLTLAEARSILAGIEQTVVEQQAAEFMAQQRLCSRCGQERSCKGRPHIVFSRAVWQVEVGESTTLSLPVRVE